MKHAPTFPALPRPKWLRGLLGAGSLLALSLWPGQARAQADISPPPPNVLLLVDTSGSMDYKTSSNSFPTCHYAGSTTTVATSERSRWIDLVEVLTGSIKDYDCQRLDRNSAGFRSEYALGGSPPYDALYANPYNRPTSAGCVAGPGSLDPVNQALFPANAIKFHPFDNTAGSCTFNQATDGVLDAFSSDVRFGLMTFDTEPRPAKDMSGLWSYFLTTSKQGEPIGCTTLQDQEVGVRNPLAPPWEGRAVGFGNPALGSLDYKNRNDMIQKVLLATRPYGATPIAGMLDDARTFLISDQTDDPIDSSFKFGPQNDPASKCRGGSIILLSDGQPNMDLRPFCEPNGCPYEKPEDIAQDLKARGFEIYVIGFALPTVNVNGTPVSCGDTQFAQTSTGPCKDFPNDASIQACCSLNRIAAAGGHARVDKGDADWTHAHFADNRATLRSELSQAIGGNFKTTSRTPFVNASGAGFVNQGADLDFARSFRFSASFKPGKLDRPWVGQLNRSRYQCIADSSGVVQPVLQKSDESLGDMFVSNVNKGGADARQIFTVVGAAPVKSSASMRPNLPPSVVDGVGSYSGTMNTTAYKSDQFVANVPPDAIGVNDTTCDTSTVNLNAAQCRDLFLNWLTGIKDGNTYSRCPSADDCNLVSEIYHSVPRAVPGRPAQFLIDSTYQKFIKDQAKRPSMIYASSNDGFLHAFKIGAVGYANEPTQVKSLESNELWTFVPPGVLTGIPSLYPAAHQLLLDGSPTIKEVVASKDDSLPDYRYRLQRTLTQAQTGANEWRTILVQSYGQQRPGYFALDITNPTLDAGGPKFLWQLSTDSAGNPLFGTGGATPLITTVFLDGNEVAVAVLPGGYTNTPGTNKIGNVNAGCSRKKTDYDTNWPAGVPAPRTDVKCYYGDDAKRARSVTVVRLDSGEILRTFRQDHNEVPGIPSALVSEVPLDSPMTGQPVAYPPDVAGVADRVFMGDQDGTMWRLNFASEKGKVSDWTMDLFFDGFPKDLAGDPTKAWKAGQPIIAAPVMSVDDAGNITIAFSTGDQEAVGADPGMVNFVWSLREKPNANRTILNPEVLWHLDFKDAPLAGDRVIGEMALFNGDLFFTTLGPGVANDACGSGSGKLWGMHYTEPNTAGAGTGGKVSTTLSKLVGSGGYVDATTLLGSDVSAYLSGAIVSQQPTCEKPGTVNDPGYSGYGVVSTAGTAPAGKFQLLIPTGNRVSTSTKPGVNIIENGGSNAVAIDLDTPAVTLVVDSWAAIVE
ncbi:MAG TPA: hypothetical protein VHB79_14260 [Polyangiaceae bacterium]|nr:hypothetical protein [Polyangiaceae bacterium]